VHYWEDLQSKHGFRCYNNIAPNAKYQRVLVLAVCLIVDVVGPYNNFRDGQPLWSKWQKCVILSYGDFRIWESVNCTSHPRLFVCSKGSRNVILISKFHTQTKEHFLRFLLLLLMVALWNRADHYIFILWFLLLLSSSSSFSSPNLSRHRLHVCHTSTHDVALVRI